MDDKELQEIKQCFDWGIKAAGEGQGYANLDDEQVQYLFSTIEGLKSDLQRLKTNRQICPFVMWQNVTEKP